jgi:hypothetical protein
MACLLEACGPRTNGSDYPGQIRACDRPQGRRGALGIEVPPVPLAGGDEVIESSSDAARERDVIR